MKLPLAPPSGPDGKNRPLKYSSKQNAKLDTFNAPMMPGKLSYATVGSNQSNAKPPKKNKPSVIKKHATPLARYAGTCPFGVAGPSNDRPGTKRISSNCTTANTPMIFHPAAVPQRTGLHADASSARKPTARTCSANEATEPPCSTLICHTSKAAGGQQISKHSGANVRRKSLPCLVAAAGRATRGRGELRSATSPALRPPRCRPP